MTEQPAEAIERRVRSAGLLAPGRPVVVLLSGGRDSTCLLELAVAIAGREAVLALHVNYALREAADADERHCERLCAQLGVPLEVRHPSRPETGNVQAWARDERYGVAVGLALGRGGDVAAGHTATDQVETILYRLASSPSRRALLGMRPREGLLVRPLLELTREQTAAYCAQRGLGWREDESNDSDAYARNRIRAELVPALLAVHPGAADNVLALAEILREEATVLDALVDAALSGRGRIELARLRELEPALARLVVQRLADDAAGGLAPGVARRADEIAAMSDRGSVQLDVGGGVTAVAEYGVVHFEARGAAPELAPPAVRLPIPGSVVFGEHEVHCELGPPTREPGVLDRAALGDELLVRSWRAGDRMAPLGLRGSKSLQDLFTARRVPRRERAGVAVVESGGEIVWVAGVATSERYKVTESTGQSVRLSASRRPPRS
ncbi:MAG TPA: tRNA lysidine(34) synthetase TilS [Solirubrobacteraceae bacterium]